MVGAAAISLIALHNDAVSQSTILLCPGDVSTKVYALMEIVVLLLLFAWLISTAVMTVRSGTELRQRDTMLHSHRLSAATAPMRSLSPRKMRDTVH